MIRSALAELGCEEAPSGCPDLSAETVGVDSLDGSSPDHQVRIFHLCEISINHVSFLVRNTMRALVIRRRL